MIVPGKLVQLSNHSHAYHRAGVSSECGLNSTRFSRSDGRLNEKEANDYRSLVACLEGNVLAQDYVGVSM